MNPIARILPILALGVALAPLNAHAAGEKIIDWRQTHQEQRTDQGISNGSLNARETARIEWRSDKLGAAEDRALADGSLSKREAIRLNHAYEEQSEFIYRQKHDRQTR